MGSCIKCGKSVADGELFCRQCSLNLADLIGETPEQTAPRYQSVKTALQAPVRPVQKPAPKPPVPPARAQKPRGLIAALVISLLVAAFMSGLCAYQFLGYGKQGVALRLREAELFEREQHMQSIEQDNIRLAEELSAAEDTIDAQAQEISALHESANQARSSASQTQYDMTAQKAELDRLTEENKTLSSSYEALEKEHLQLEKDSALYKTKADFMDSYVVFVENDGTGYYHRYDCGNFPRKSFWAYSRRLAESNGYHACPHCMN